MKRSISTALAVLALLAPRLAGATAPMNHVRWLHTLTKLPDGRVLAAGGAASANTAEVYDPKTDTWKDTQTTMLYGHVWHTANPICGGRVLVAGGGNDAELYDPKQDKWIDTGKTLRSHVYGTSVELLDPDCRVMLVAGYKSNYWGEIYTPAKHVFEDAGGHMNNERFFHTATRLQDGRVLVAAGGINGSGTWASWTSADIYNPTTQTWIKAGKLKYARRGHSATLLSDGRVLVAGGTVGGNNDGDSGQQIDTTEIYDPATNKWTEGPKLNTARTLHTAMLLPSGVVLVLGGLDATGSATRKVEGYVDGAWKEGPPLEADRFLHAAVMLDDGGVLLTGGIHQATAEIYRTAPLGTACVNGAACESGFCAGGVCCNEACADGCRRCDLPGHVGTCAAQCADTSHTLGCPDGAASCAPEACVATSCAPFACDGETAACNAKCTSVDQCAPGYACDMLGRCVAPPDVTDGETSCAVESPAREGSAAAWVLCGMAAAGLLVRRRRGQRRA